MLVLQVPRLELAVIVIRLGEINQDAAYVLAFCKFFSAEIVRTGCPSKWILHKSAKAGFFGYDDFKIVADKAVW